MLNDKSKFCADISKWQNDFDYVNYAKMGFKNLIIKAGQGTVQKYKTWFIQNYIKATQSGLYVIPYWFVDKSSKIDNQIIEFEDRLNYLKIYNPIAIDYEAVNTVSGDKSVDVQDVMFFIDYFQKKGYKVILYSVESFLNSKGVGFQDFKADYIWASAVGKNKPFVFDDVIDLNFETAVNQYVKVKCDIWQFTWKMQGIHSTPIDFNFIFNEKIFNF